jgi:hypothetical protein
MRFRTFEKLTSMRKQADVSNPSSPACGRGWNGTRR